MEHNVFAFLLSNYQKIISKKLEFFCCCVQLDNKTRIAQGFLSELMTDLKYYLCFHLISDLRSFTMQYKYCPVIFRESLLSLLSNLSFFLSFFLTALRTSASIHGALLVDFISILRTIVNSGTYFAMIFNEYTIIKYFSLIFHYKHNQQGDTLLRQYNISFAYCGHSCKTNNNIHIRH